MTHDPDTAPVRPGEELPVAALDAYLAERLPGAGPLTVEQFPHGHSNLTYLLRRGDQEFVLRRPPFGNQVKTAHDMGREFRVLSRLSAVYPPTARRLSTALIDNLALLHALDYQAAGLAEVGKPQGYVARQVTGWISR